MEWNILQLQCNYWWLCKGLPHGLSVLFPEEAVFEWDKQIRIEISESDTQGLGGALQPNGPSVQIWKIELVGWPGVYKRLEVTAPCEK